jgi:regulator of replication initiation timing
MMKKSLLVVTTLAVALSLSACSTKKEPVKDATPTPTQNEQTVTPKPDVTPAPVQNGTDMKPTDASTAPTQVVDVKVPSLTPENIAENKDIKHFTLDEAKQIKEVKGAIDELEKQLSETTKDMGNNRNTVVTVGDSSYIITIEGDKFDDKKGVKIMNVVTQDKNVAAMIKTSEEVKTKFDMVKVPLIKDAFSVVQIN